MYNFTSLSDIDFEFLTRDLLQKELSITLESFTSGRDKGIDLRYSSAKNGVIVVQCKHFANSKYANLKSKIKTSELDKIKKLKPTRYILVTSLGLTPANKEELLNLLDPYCRSEADIYGREDLNNLLTKFPEVEHSHFKLWLTSTAVLQKILQNEVFNQTAFETESINKKLKLYVQNESYNEALRILENDHYCIIAGVPGIGKTTLAEVLLVHYINLEYEPIVVGSDITDAFKIYQNEQKQVFFYDDFLGQTSFEEKFNKNEEQKLLRFIEMVGNSKKARFILTTREYILNQAKFAYEKLSRSQIDVNKCVISLDKYTRYDKARILYNHLYFSSLPDEYKQSLVENQNYLKIIEHKNYSPRVIEWLTGKNNEIDTKPANYFEHFINTLNNPADLWEHAYDHQLSNAAQHLILLLGTLPNEVLLEDLETTFVSYYQYSAKQRNFQINKNDFRNALKESENNFIHTDKKSEHIIIRFHNPSIRDFIEHRLVGDVLSLRELCFCSVFYEQLIKMWNFDTRRLKSSDGNLKNDKNLFVNEPDNFIARLQDTFLQKGCEIKTFVGPADKVFVQRKFSIENRIIFALKIAEMIFDGNSAAAITFLKPFYELLFERLIKQKGDKEEMISLLIRTKKSPFGKVFLDEAFLDEAKNFFMDDFYSTDEFKHFLNFKQEFEDLFSLTDLESVKEKFVEFANYEIKEFFEDSKPDPEVAEWWIDELNQLNYEFDFEIEDEIQKLKDFVANASDTTDDVDELLKTPEPIGINNTFSDADIDNMFDSLLDK